MKYLPILFLFASLFSCSAAPPAALQDEPPPETAEVSTPESPSASHEERAGIGHAILLYVPNRICDALDIVRARVRIGPGFSISVRATELLDMNMGSHSAAFVGLRGPRGEPKVPWPWGTETIEGLEVGWVGDSDEDMDHGPRYGGGEFGAGAQVVIAGIDLGVDVLEACDLVTGLLFIDLCDDDF